MSAKNLQDSTNAGRKPWKTPVLLSLRAGAAENGVGSKGDSAGGGNIHRS